MIEAMRAAMVKATYSPLGPVEPCVHMYVYDYIVGVILNMEWTVL